MAKTSLPSIEHRHNAKQVHRKVKHLIQAKKKVLPARHRRTAGKKSQTMWMHNSYDNVNKIIYKKPTSIRWVIDEKKPKKTEKEKQTWQ